MRSIMDGLLIGVAGLAVITAPAVIRAQDPPAPPPPPPSAPGVRDVRADRPAAGLTPQEAATFRGILVPLVLPLQEKTIAGLAEQATAEVLPWDTVYTLALVRARSGSSSTAETLDPGALAERARRYGVADFARFRREFLAGRVEEGGPFRDPGRMYFRILQRLGAVEAANRHVARLWRCEQLLRELIQGESAGVSQLEIDLLAEAGVRARRGASIEIADYRDELDELRVALGLSPHAPVLPDRRPVAAFREVWEAADAWSRRPDRNLAELPRIIGRLPELGDAIVNDRPILRTTEQAPDRMEDMLRDAARLAITSRAGTRQDGAAGGDVALELRVRHRIRHLLETRRGYEDATRSYELAIRLTDHAFERLLRPVSPLLATSQLASVVAIFAGNSQQIRSAEERLVALCTEFRAERLELYRDLGVLPYDNWDAFYANLAARPTAAEPKR